MDKELVSGIILVVVIVVVGALILGLPSSISTEKTVTQVSTPSPTATAPSTEDAASMTMQTSCDWCHADSRNEALHVNGGELCTQCHGGSNAEVHQLHTVQVCGDCHVGTPPSVPTADEGRSVCEKCHAYPVPSEPSYGNLVDIHIPRGVECTSCHTGPIGEIH